MTPEYKPGDVAMVDYGVGQEAMMLDHRLWWSPTTEISVDDPEIVSVRPLVVIDPASANEAITPDEAVRQAVETLRESDYLSDSRLADQIEQQWNPTPPKPVEPLGLGAVIEDTEGRVWVRAALEDPGWRWDQDGEGTWDTWDGLNVACVLSEGWTA